MLAEEFIKRFYVSFYLTPLDFLKRSPFCFDLPSLPCYMQIHKGNDAMLRAVRRAYSIALSKVKILFCGFADSIQKEYLSAQTSYIVPRHGRSHSRDNTIHERFNKFVDAINKLCIRNKLLTYCLDYQNVKETLRALEQLLSNSILFDAPLNRFKFHLEREAKEMCTLFCHMLNLYLLIYDPRSSDKWFLEGLGL